ncbi:FRG domain-containing protein [Pseudomonas sp. Irchel 3E19]|uniref:FRG domain-containing protein n=1 Tax=Pseudomonas sp. Irchel 3E19 TaxID=2008981 RepID=UPI000BA2E3B5|nr:FRG domain-containing protein [Pseudomonas sp. Irchel 3E19]
MARSPRWQPIDHMNGVYEYKLSSWKYFSDFITGVLINHTTYVFRGHGNSDWKLEPTLDRILKDPESPIRESHLEKFKFETRGRRGSNPIRIDEDNDWWALGQHHGLATPLLDWTESPFVALFFAANMARSEKAERFSVHAISQESIRIINERINSTVDAPLTNGHRQTVKIVRPLSDENKRLVSQRGLFTRGPNNIDLETWVKNNTHEGYRSVRLLKITMPSKGADDCIKYLNRMNINHSTLFPDLPGASEFCNLHLKLQKY